MKELVYFRLLFLIGFILLGVASSLLVPHILKGEETRLILRFMPYGGDNIIGGAKEVFGIIFTGFIIACINLIIGREFFPKTRTLAIIISSANLLLSLLLFVAIAVIVISNK